MDKLIDLNTYPVSENLKALLKDKTTKKNIIFATGKRQPVARSIWIIAVCIFILKMGLFCTTVMR